MAFDVQREIALPESAKGKAEKTRARMRQLFSGAVFLETLRWGAILEPQPICKGLSTLCGLRASRLGRDTEREAGLATSVATSAVRERDRVDPLGIAVSSQ